MNVKELFSELLRLGLIEGGIGGIRETSVAREEFSELIRTGKVSWLCC